MRRYIIAVVVVVIILVSFFSCIPSDSSISTPEEPIRIFAEDLRWEYKRNEAVANDKYKDKVLEVNGVIHNIGISDDDIPFIILDDGSDNAAPAVRCNFDKRFKPQLDQLSIGHTLIVWGRVDRYYYYIVLLKDCSLSKPLTTTEPTSSISEPNP